MTPRELALAALRGEPTPRPAVLCPGGMMSFAVQEAMVASASPWPAAHTDAALMARLAVATQQATGFDNVGLPFCMTVEAEALGSQVELGTETVQPYIAHEALASAAAIAAWQPPASPARDRRPVVLEAVRLARAAVPDIAVLGSVIGPSSLAGQLLELSLLLRAMHRQPEAVHALTEHCLAFVADFALALIAAGADAVMIADPNATGEILGARRFDEFARPYLARLIAAVHAAGVPVILHLCGDPKAILPSLATTGAEAISLDETANLAVARAALTDQRLMGNLSGTVLEQGPEALIASNARGVLRAGVDILAPACGVVPCTPAAHLRQMVAQAHKRDA